MRGARACRSWREALWRQVDSTLRRGEDTRLREHLLQCSNCRQAYELAGSLDRALAAEPLASPAHDFQERVMLGVVAGIQGGRRQPERTRRGKEPSGEAADWWVLLGGLGGALLVVVISISVLSRITLKAVTYAVDSPSSAATAFGEGLAQGFQQGLLALGDSLSVIIQMPLSFGLVLMGALLAATLGWLGHSLSRSSAS